MDDKYGVGDVVEVVDKGMSYTTHSEADKYNFKNYVRHESPKNGSTGTICGEPFKQGFVWIYPIDMGNQQYLVDNRGLKLVSKKVEVVYKRDDFSIPPHGSSKTYIILKGSRGARYLTTEGKIGTWRSRDVIPFGDIIADDNNAWFDTKQEAEQALTEFLNNQNKGEKEMKKSDLVNGMVVEMRDGDKYMVLKTRNFEAIVNEDDYSNLRGYNEDLTDPEDKDFDIVAIYEPRDAHEAEMDVWGTLEPIWERSEHKELTVAEIEKQLGYKVKIVK